MSENQPAAKPAPPRAAQLDLSIELSNQKIEVKKSPSPFTLTYWIHKRIDRTGILQKEDKPKFLKLSPYSNVLSFERKLLMDVI